MKRALHILFQLVKDDKFYNDGDPDECWSKQNIAATRLLIREWYSTGDVMELMPTVAIDGNLAVDWPMEQYDWKSVQCVADHTTNTLCLAMIRDQKLTYREYPISVDGCAKLFASIQRRRVPVVV